MRREGSILRLHCKDFLFNIGDNKKWRDDMGVKKGYQEYIKELGQKIKLYRIMNEMSQQDLEEQSGVSKRSISRLEQGESIQVDNLFKILVALDLGDNIELLIPDQTKRPSYYLRREEKEPKRVGKRTKKSNFKWGDEEW